MTCPQCGRYAPPDPQTGYDEDGLCPDCEREHEADLALPTESDSETLEQSIARLEAAIDRHVIERAKIRAVLARFYRVSDGDNSQLRAEALFAVMQLAVELDPSLHEDADAIINADSSPF